VSSSQALTISARFAIYGRMTSTKLDLTGLKCPLPALKTRKALKALKPGDRLEVRCTDPLSVIDIPNLIRETGDKVEITERAESGIVFLIEKANEPIGKTNDMSPGAAGS
jgi:tRNA 2-thiouridine synthesizing protein A